jgi:hypothetical protein
MSLRSKWTAGKARGGHISESIRNRRATQPPAHFQHNPLDRGQLAVFPRCSLDPYQFRYGRFARVLKNSQLTCGDVNIYMRDGALDGGSELPQKYQFNQRTYERRYRFL